jgi:hypothetical protein
MTLVICHHSLDHF